MVINPNDYSESYLNARLTHFVRRVHCARRQLLRMGIQISPAMGGGITYNLARNRWERIEGSATCFGIILVDDSVCSHERYQYTSDIENACSMSYDSVSYGFYYGYSGSSYDSVVNILSEKHWTVDACYWIGRYFRDLNKGNKIFTTPGAYPKLSHLFKAPA